MRVPDPFGLAILDHHRGRRKEPCIIERDDGFTWEEPISPYFEGEENWMEEERKALSSAGGRVLDLGCGPGRHLLSLQRRAWVVGLDVSSRVLAVCRERGGKNLILGSARRLPFRGASFDHVLLMSNGLGIAGAPHKTAEMLGDIRRVLPKTGLLIAHTTDPEDPESGIDPRYVSKNREKGRPPGLLKVRVRYGEMIGPWFELMLLTPGEVRSFLERAGLVLRRPLKWSPAWAASILYFASPARQP